MKIGIFYFSPIDGKDRQPISISLGPTTPPGLVFIRCQVVVASSLERALGMARPREDEHVMNTHALE